MGDPPGREDGNNESDPDARVIAHGEYTGSVLFCVRHLRLRLRHQAEAHEFGVVPPRPDTVDNRAVVALQLDRVPARLHGRRVERPVPRLSRIGNGRIAAGRGIDRGTARWAAWLDNQGEIAEVLVEDAVRAVDYVADF